MAYLNNKIVIVTGASRGIGFTIVQHLLRNGAAYAAVFDIHETDSEIVSNMKQNLEKEFDQQRFGYYICNVTDYKMFNACYDKVTNDKGYVDILVNNAGICNENKADLMIEINFTAMIKGTIAAIERMSKHKGHKGGTVINVASVSGLKNVPLMPIYCATKHAVVSYVRAMKDHNETLGIRIMAICPGLTKTHMTTNFSIKEMLPDFIPKEMISDYSKLSLQSPNTVASAVIEMLEKGEKGECWLSQNDQAPIVVQQE